MNSVKNANPIFYKWCDTSLKFPLPLPAIIFRIRRASSHYAQHTLSDMHCRSCIEINVYLYLYMPDESSSLSSNCTGGKHCLRFQIFKKCILSLEPERLSKSPHNCILSSDILIF